MDKNMFWEMVQNKVRAKSEPELVRRGVSRFKVRATIMEGWESLKWMSWMIKEWDTLISKATEEDMKERVLEYLIELENESTKDEVEKYQRETEKMSLEEKYYMLKVNDEAFLFYNWFLRDIIVDTKADTKADTKVIVDNEWEGILDEEPKPAPTIKQETFNKTLKVATILLAKRGR